MKKFIVMTALAAWSLSPLAIASAYAQDGHAHEESHESHDITAGHAHDDSDEHNDHNEAADTHDDHGHGDHGGAEKTDSHDDHGHREASQGEDNHGDDHGAEKGDDGHGHGEDSHGEEGKATIAPESATRMGMRIEKVASGEIGQTIPLTGRITLNQNTRADIRARFAGIVRSVRVNLGDTVQKGDVLAVIESNESLQDYNVLSPINGVVLARNTNTGDVAGEQALFTIADLSDVWAKFHVFPRDADSIANGQSVAIHTLEGDKTANGKIDILFPTADEISQTHIAIVVLPNAEQIWKPGMTIEGDVTISSNAVTVAIKEVALQKMEELGDVVFVQNGTSYEPRPVTTGRKGNGYIEITKGLKAGESYVAEGSFIVKSDILKSTAAHSH